MCSARQHFSPQFGRFVDSACLFLLPFRFAEHLRNHWVFWLVLIILGCLNALIVRIKRLSVVSFATYCTMEAQRSGTRVWTFRMMPLFLLRLQVLIVRCFVLIFFYFLDIVRFALKRQISVSCGKKSRSREKEMLLILEKLVEIEAFGCGIILRPGHARITLLIVAILAVVIGLICMIHDGRN